MNRLEPLVKRILFFCRNHFCVICAVTIGLLAGWYGVFVGLILGILLDTVRKAFSSEKLIRSYLEFPAHQNIKEPSPGAAAFCALASSIVLMSLNQFGKKKYSTDFSFIQQLVVADCISSLHVHKTWKNDIELFVGISFSKNDSLNIDLLSESLAGRRLKENDISILAERLHAMAFGSKSQKLADRICSILSPGKTWQKIPEHRNLEPEEAWQLLGLAPSSTEREIKSVFRKLAAQFHPDALTGLEDQQVQTATQAFMRIEQAYRLALETLATGPSKNQACF